MMPLFPVILKPRYANFGINMENIQSVLSLYVSLKTNIENVTYINLFEFLFRELDLRIELDHLMTIIEFVGAFNETFESGLASNHQIFMNQELPAIAEKSAQIEEEFKEDLG